MSKTGILVVSEYFLQIKQYRTHRRESEYSNSTAIKTNENRSDLADLRNNLAIIKLGSKFKPNVNFQFDYDISLRKSNQTEDNDLQTNSVT
jgi:hypothetical protein